MLFNSVEFALFLPLVFFGYWFLFKKTAARQNAFIAAASFLFYGWWDWRFLLLMIVTSLIDFFVAILIDNTDSPGRKKRFLLISIISNLGTLGFFKYYNFFAGSFSDAFRFFGHQPDVTTLNIVLPIGISFYTFQALSYTIDVYRGRLRASRDPVTYFAFISFFPQLVAGPIGRANILLPQFSVSRTFNYASAVDGSRQMLWGFFKKVVIADNCSVYVNKIFDHYGDYSGSTLVVGAVLFAFQIYCDFSGYSDIAIGTGRLFGIELNRNFAFPYFSRDIAEFWRRWHISLTTWFKDYVYIPLGGSRGSRWKNVRNVFIVFLLSGLWHGANWTFVIWGLINAIYFLPLLLRNENRKYLDDIDSRFIPSFRDFLAILVTFAMTCFAWIFFRAANFGEAIGYIRNMISLKLFTWPLIFPKREFLWIGVLLLMEWIQRHQQHALTLEAIRIPKGIRWGIYFLLVGIIFWFAGRQQLFIYFQF